MGPDRFPEGHHDQPQFFGDVGLDHLSAALAGVLADVAKVFKTLTIRLCIGPSESLAASTGSGRGKRHLRKDDVAGELRCVTTRRARIRAVRFDRLAQPLDELRLDEATAAPLFP